MSRKKSTTDDTFLFFDVLYADGMRTSNRKVPSAQLQEWDRDASLQAVIEAQDGDIAKRSGKERGAIKAITPSSVR
jgi:hypothetical protein